MDKLTGVIEMRECKVPFYKNDYDFDFITLDTHPFQSLLPAETVPTNEGFVTGWTQNRYFIAIYAGRDSFRTNAATALHTYMYIISKNNASDVWRGEPVDGITFLGGCIDKVYHGHTLVPQDDPFRNDSITLLKNKDAR